MITNYTMSILRVKIYFIIRKPNPIIIEFNILKKMNSRLISANIKTKAMIAETNQSGEVIYSYITAGDSSEGKDWREISDAEWAKMLEGIDENIEAIKERIKQMLKQKEEAARKAASQSDSDMKANAISQAKGINIYKTMETIGINVFDNLKTLYIIYIAKIYLLNRIFQSGLVIFFLGFTTLT